MSKLEIKEYNDLAQRIHYKVEELNQLMEEAHEKGLRVGISDNFLSKYSQNEPTRAIVCINLRFTNKHKN